jgi:hypothetical protein
MATLAARVTALAQAVAADIKALTTTVAARLPLAGGTLSGAINEATPVTLASAATINIGAAAANTINISGTTTITAFDTITAGARRTLRFSGALTLTYDATKLILPRATNITTFAGDVADFVSLGSGNWACIGYERATAASAKGDLGLAKGDVGLGNVDNTSDISKPISTATQSALDAKASKTSPQFTDAVSVGDKGTFTARGTPSGNQTGITLNLPSAPADKRSFEILSSTSENGRLTFRTINDAYTAAHEFMIAYRSTAADHTMDRVIFRAVNMVVGQSDQLNSAYRLQILGGIYATGPIRPGQYTLATLPSASSNSGAEIDVTDASGGPKRCRSNGTNWIILNTTTTVS